MKCDVCGEDLWIIMRTRNNWFQRLFKPDEITVGMCFDHDYTRMEMKSRRGETKIQFWHKEDPTRTNYHWQGWTE